MVSNMHGPWKLNCGSLSMFLNWVIKKYSFHGSPSSLKIILMDLELRIIHGMTVSLPREFVLALFYFIANYVCATEMEGLATKEIKMRKWECFPFKKKHSCCFARLAQMCEIFINICNFLHIDLLCSQPVIF